MKYEDWKKIHEYCMNKPCTYESRPFGEYPICYRVAGKIYVQLTLKESWFKATFKTNPDAADFYRQAYPGIIVRGYHCPPVQQPYWNTAELYELPMEVVYQMIDEAYEEVVSGLTKKLQKRIPLLTQYSFQKTDGENPDFISLCDELDRYLESLVGKEHQQAIYASHNTREQIHDVIMIYNQQGKAVGCGSYKFYDDRTVELKRIYILEHERGKGLVQELILRLEADARLQGYSYSILETGEQMESAICVYKKMGYKIIENYVPYVGLEESVCMKKKI